MSMEGSLLLFRRWSVVLVVAAVGLIVGVPAAQATWSVVAVDEETGEVGVAVASCVGFEVTVVPMLVPGIGAAASQASISELSGQRLVESMSGGATAEQAVEAVVDADDAAEDRQFGVVVLGGGGAGWTGSGTLDVTLDLRGQDGTVSAQGYILVSEDVATAALAGFENSDGDLADRLLAGLLAGADAGGDSRCGEQTARSAALIVARPGDQDYAHTAAGVLGVDPNTDSVPSVFVSVLVEEGGERAPDRLAQAWAGADRSSDTVVIRQIDAGADSAAQSSGNLVGIFLGIIVLVVVAVIAAAVTNRRRKRIA